MTDDRLTIAAILSWTQGVWLGKTEALQLPCAAISTDSRTVQPGEVFVALAGERFNGHTFVEQVLKRGAAAAVVSRKWLEKNAHVKTLGNLLVVNDTLAAYQNAAAAYRQLFLIPAVAVTGSAGKTTTKEAIYAVLSQRFNVLRNKKSFNNHIGVPATLFELDKNHQILLTELGTNHFGELDRLSYLVHPDMAMITNIGHAHLAFFKDLQGVVRAKFEIFNHCAADGLALYNGDDALLRVQNYPLPRTFSFALRQAAALKAEVIACNERAEYTIRLLGETIQLPISGHHNVYNALAAAAIGVQFDITAAEIKTALQSLQPVEKRMQVVRAGDILMLNDTYNANPNSCGAALHTLADLSVTANGRKIAVLGDMLELGDVSVSEHRHLAESVAEHKLDLLLLYGRETQATLERADELHLEVLHFSDKEALLAHLTAYIRPGDVVLFKGSRGMQMETLVDGLSRFLEENPDPDKPKPL